MTNPPHVSLVLPCRDEAEALPAVLASVPGDWQVVVVDNGSTDATAEVARRAGAEVVHESRPGYGAAVHAGVLAARPGLVLVCDGDGSIDPGDLSELAELVIEGRCDLACGRRRPTPGAWPWHARWGNHLLAGLISVGAGTRLHDIAPCRAADRDALLGLDVTDRRFGYPLELLIRAHRSGWRIIETDVTYGARRGGRSKVSGSVLGTARAIRDFLSVLSRAGLRGRR